MTTPRKKTKRKPIVESDGFASVKIYRVSLLRPSKEGKPRARYKYWRIIWYVAGDQRMENRATLEGARKRAKELAGLLAAGKEPVTHLSRSDIETLNEARALLGGLDAGVLDACRQFAKAMAVLDGRGLDDAVRYYVRMHPKDMVAKQVSEVIEELCREKQQRGVSAAYVSDLGYLCGKFAAMCSKSIGDVTSVDLFAFKKSLTALKIVKDPVTGVETSKPVMTERSRNNCLAALRELFKFAKDKRYVPRDFDALDGVKDFIEQPGTIAIFSPEDMSKLLKHADAKIIPALAIRAFAGLRGSEVRALDWSEINFSEKVIEITARKAKTRSRRHAPLTKNLIEWLSPYAKDSGPVVPLKRWEYRKLMDKLKVPGPAGVAWKQNALRHSFVSYRLADSQNAAKVANEAGHNQDMLFRNYRNLVTRAKAKLWFGILPKGSPKVVSLAGAA